MRLANHSYFCVSSPYFVPRSNAEVQKALTSATTPPPSSRPLAPAVRLAASKSFAMASTPPAAPLPSTAARVGPRAKGQHPAATAVRTGSLFMGALLQLCGQLNPQHSSCLVVSTQQLASRWIPLQCDNLSGFQAAYVVQLPPVAQALR